MTTQKVPVVQERKAGRVGVKVLEGIGIDLGGDPLPDLADTLQEALSREGSRRAAGSPPNQGSFALRLCAAVHGKFPYAKLVSEGDFDPDTVVSVSPEGSVTVTTREGKVLHHGPVSEMSDWASEFSELDSFVGQIVRFDYQGGSQIGPRIIKVEYVGRGEEEGTFVLTGLDLQKMEHRTYRRDRIKGEIQRVI